MIDDEEDLKWKRHQFNKKILYFESTLSHKHGVALHFSKQLKVLYIPRYFRYTCQILC